MNGRPNLFEVEFLILMRSNDPHSTPFLLQRPRVVVLILSP